MAEPMAEMDATKEPVAEAAPESPGKRPRRWLLWAVLGAVAVLLIAAAFIGGQLVARQRLAGPAGLVRVEMELPSEVPQEPPAAMGLVKKIEGKVVVVEEGGGGPGGGMITVGGGPAEAGGGVVTKSFSLPGVETKQTEVVITNDTVFYKATPPSQEEMRGQGTVTMKVQGAAFEDLQSGQVIQVWGEKSGGRVTAEFVLINEPLSVMGP